MSILGEFVIPADEFVFHQTFLTEPNLVIEIERVVATDEILTPYFWVSNVTADAFEAATREDPTVENVRKLDEFEAATHYRSSWTDRIETLLYAYTHIGAAIVEAEGTHDEWLIQMRFDGHDELDEFNDYLGTNDVSYELRRLYEISHPRSAGQFGLTSKQYETLTTAWEMGYFDLPRKVTMEEVASKLNISPQSFSDRLRRAQNTLIRETLRVSVPSDPEFSRSGT